MKRFLVLGAGFVAQPMVEYLHRNKNNTITIAGYSLEEAQILANKFDSVVAMQADVADANSLNKLVANFDVVVSLVPASFHVLIAKACIHNKVNMVTASYQSQAIQALAGQAKTAGICILNEMGLDPGIDHLSAMEIIDKVHDKGESIESFVSWCGGIPAVDYNNNPFGYKFSWEPRGAIMVLLNDALYQQNNRAVKVKGEDLMRWAKPIAIEGLNLECYPNRESISYKNIYGIEKVQDILRGTLRYRGFCGIFQDVKSLGLMNLTDNPSPKNTTWKNYVLSLNNAKEIAQIKSKINPKTWQALDWAGVFSDALVAQKSCSLDALCALLLDKLSYASGEKDMVVLQHKFVIKKASGDRYFISSVLKQTGKPQGYSAMAKTVGYPVAMAAQLIADGKIKRKGLLLPVTQDIYQPILKLLRIEGIQFEEQKFSETDTSKAVFLSELIPISA